MVPVRFWTMVPIVFGLLCELFPACFLLLEIKGSCFQFSMLTGFINQNLDFNMSYLVAGGVLIGPASPGQA